MNKRHPKYLVPTEAMISLLRWLYPRGEYAEFNGGLLISYYEERAHAQGRIYARGGYANHGWRRAGGKALKNLADRGFLEFTVFHYGTPYYRFTDEGYKYIKENLT